MRWLSLFLASQHLNWGVNYREWQDQSWFKAQAIQWDVFANPVSSLTPRVCVPQVDDHCDGRTACIGDRLRVSIQTACMFPTNKYKFRKVNMNGTLKTPMETRNAYRNFVREFDLIAIVWKPTMFDVENYLALVSWQHICIVASAHSSNIWVRQWQMKIRFMRKLEEDWILVMLATIRSRTFCLLVCFLET
jgi:hypothetical protein